MKSVDDVRDILGVRGNRAFWTKDREHIPCGGCYSVDKDNHMKHNL